MNKIQCDHSSCPHFISSKNNNCYGEIEGCDGVCDKETLDKILNELQKKEMDEE